MIQSVFVYVRCVLDISACVSVGSANVSLNRLVCMGCFISLKYLLILLLLHAVFFCVVTCQATVAFYSVSLLRRREAHTAIQKKKKNKMRTCVCVLSVLMAVCGLIHMCIIRPCANCKCVRALGNENINERREKTPCTVLKKCIRMPEESYCILSLILWMFMCLFDLRCTTRTFNAWICKRFCSFLCH